MELKKNEIKSPYDLREFIWYIIPGATVLLSIFLFEYWFAVQIRNVEGYNKNDSFQSDTVRSDTSHLKIKISKIKPTNDSLVNLQDSLKHALLRLSDSIKVDNKLNKELLTKLHTPIFTTFAITNTPFFISKQANKLAENWIFSAIYLLLLLTLCYITGHITYIVGTFIFERGLIAKGYSYPYLKLLDLTDDDPNNEKSPVEIKASQGYYQGLFFWLTIIFVTMFLLFIFWGYDWSSQLENANLTTLTVNLQNISSSTNSTNAELPNSYYFKIIFASLIIVLIVIPTRLKLRLFNITQYQKYKLTKTPKRGGYFYWPVITIIIITFLYIFKIKPNEVISFTGLPALIFKIFTFQQDVLIYSFIVVQVIALEILIRLVVQFQFLGRFVVAGVILEWLRAHLREIHKSEDYIDPYENYIIQSRFDAERIAYEYFFIRLYNFIGKGFDTAANYYFRTQSRFDTKFINKYRNSFVEVFKENYRDFKRNNYWFSKFFVMENSKYLSLQLNFWENNYRFAKNLSASFLIAFIYSAISIMVQYREIRYLLREKFWNIAQQAAYETGINAKWVSYHYQIEILILIPLAFFIVAVLVLRYYFYVYDNRYSRMVLRSFVSITSSNEYINKKEKPESTSVVIAEVTPEVTTGESVAIPQNENKVTARYAGPY